MLNHNNESRLYLAYYARGSSKPGELPTFHVALLLTPKNPPNPFFNSNPTPGVVQYHVTNPIDAATRKQVWKYEEKTTFLLRPVAVLLLGKVDAGDESTLLRAIPLVQDVPEWRCHSWLWAAINVRFYELRFKPIKHL
ncbi:hypothetical protein FB45DRAFT_900225 [Roridomyces roridus]|uniref:Uncharacterized protein n=1 Tax=Roridomyces roridus TaxID=1738132 RepID=A0AAD7C852_9AGAR|nr:hypothetical protein FB45DRAFT_900225 [Roridomyces roridus]